MFGASAITRLGARPVDRCGLQSCRSEANRKAVERPSEGEFIVAAFKVGRALIWGRARGVLSAMLVSQVNYVRRVVKQVLQDGMLHV